MKFFAVILATFILVLSIVPFEGACCDTQCEEVYSGLDTKSDQENNGGQQNETCPPLCGCQCSHIHVISVVYNKVDRQLAPVNDHKLPRAYNDGISFDLIHAIWHPPKIS